MRLRKSGILTSLVFFAFLMQGCIHEYPTPVKGNSSDKGENPSAINANIEVTFDLSWESLLYNVKTDTKSRARTERPHRFVVEVLKDGEPVCHDLNYLSPEEFSLGKLNHKLSVPLEASGYQIAVWYDIQDDDGNNSYNTENLKNVSLSNSSTTAGEFLQCAYASDFIDLTEYSNSKEEISVTKELELSHAGARFEIVATDIQKFIETYKASLNQGDSFTAHIYFTHNVPTAFNLHSNMINYGDNLSLSGKMRLPFAEYDELKIAEGFIFCTDESDVTMKLEVKNSALIPVCRTDFFSFPIKRGYITTVTGDFLSSPVDGVFSVNTIWEGEIVIEI
ncbi:MAG: hypothetical protein J1F67_07070 [Muribaculaceae bacterium]|nr:hypothetical protein [Muribaculaceae bacterium]